MESEQTVQLSLKPSQRLFQRPLTELIKHRASRTTKRRHAHEMYKRHSAGPLLEEISQDINSEKLPYDTLI